LPNLKHAGLAVAPSNILSSTKLHAVSCRLLNLTTTVSFELGRWRDSNAVASHSTKVVPLCVILIFTAHIVRRKVLKWVVPQNSLRSRLSWAGHLRSDLASIHNLACLALGSLVVFESIVWALDFLSTKDLAYSLVIRLHTSTRHLLACRW